LTWLTRCEVEFRLQADRVLAEDQRVHIEAEGHGRATQLVDTLGG
jgi:hypothetical protein